jgi:aquaporin Z
MLMEAVLTFGLVSVILGTASGAQNVGLFGGIGVGGYIALAGLWGSPISGASMNPARTFGPDLVGVEFNHYWVYVAGPLLGMLVAVVAAFVLRGPGGDRAAAAAAQGTLSPELLDAKDQVLDAKHDVLDAKDDVLQAKDDVLDAKDDVLQEREGPSP